MVASTWSSSGAPARAPAPSSRRSWRAPSPDDSVSRCRRSCSWTWHADFGRAEPDPEIRELLERSAGLNAGLRFLPHALPFRPGVSEPPDADTAAAIVWLDALTTNIDRTPRNPNLLTWQGGLWLIDHGAALYVQHTWRDPDAHARRPFPQAADHVLLPYAGVAHGRRLATGADAGRGAARRRPGAGPRRLAARPARLVRDATWPGAWRTRDRSSTRPRQIGVPRCRANHGVSAVTARRRVPMPERVQFQYAILRVVPDVERGERLNAGIVLLCRPQRFLAARVHLDVPLLLQMAPGADVGPHRIAPRAHPQAVRRRRRRGSARIAAAGRAVPLDRLAQQHDGPAVGGAHGADLGRRGDARRAHRPAGPACARSTDETSSDGHGS